MLVLTESLPVLRAQFCWSGHPSGEGWAVHLFRREFDLVAPHASRRILVSAYGRYVVWVNGERVGRGPLKGTLKHYHAETYELASLLRAGRNVLAIEVRWFGQEGPESEVHGLGAGLFVQDGCSEILDTPGEWKVFRDQSVAPSEDESFSNSRQFLGPMDHLTPARRPRCWTLMAFDATNWERAISVGPSLQPGGFGIQPARRLMPRDIPALTEEPREFARVFLSRVPVALPWRLAPGEGGEIWLDAGALTTGYVELGFDGGGGRQVRIVYAEALGRWEEVAGQRRWRKAAPRGDVAQPDLEPHGYRDALELPGGPYDFETFHWRTFWFIKVEILPGQEAVTLRGARYRFTTYPQVFSAHFECAEPLIRAYWENSLHTLRLCAHETYEDCPYYEQLNYAADTRLQALCGYYLANHVLLARRSVRLFRDSLDASGLTAARVPARGRQIIPTFSLHWVLMLGEYWHWWGEEERAFVRSCLGGVDAVLGYFRSRIGASGFVEKIDDWAWIDWVPEWPRGVPPVVAAGIGSTYLTALFVHALDVAIKLHREAGWVDDALRWGNLRDLLRLRLRRRAWSEADGLFTEGPGCGAHPFTQHSQVMAVLSGAADDEQKRRISQRLLDDPTLVPLSLFGRYDLARALEQSGGYACFFSDVLVPWRDMVALGLTTWLDRTNSLRSDCHGWSSWMIIDFFHSVLGARATTAGWKTIDLCPQVFCTRAARGEFSAPRGRIAVEWSRDADNHLRLTAVVPKGIPTRVKLPQGFVREYPEGGRIEIETMLGSPQAIPLADVSGPRSGRNFGVAPSHA